MEPMRLEEIAELLEHALLGRLGMAARDGTPYVIPMPFCWYDGALYLRLPGTGRKGRVLAENDRVCFEVDWFAPDLSDYASVIAEGRLVPVVDAQEKMRIRRLNEIKYCRLRGSARKGHGRTTRIEDLCLSKIEISELGGRKKEAAADESFDASRRGAKGCPLCGTGKRRKPKIAPKRPSTTGD